MPPTTSQQTVAEVVAAGIARAKDGARQLPAFASGGFRPPLEAVSMVPSGGEADAQDELSRRLMEAEQRLKLRPIPRI